MAHRSEVIHGDCVEVMGGMDDGSVDMILTDPPYGFGRFETDTKDYLDVVGPALREAWRTLKSPGSMFVFMSTGEIINVANAVGAEHFKRCLWMYKPADMTYPLAGWLLTTQAILWFHKGDRVGLAERKPYAHDVYTVKTVGKEGVDGHPTVKPLAVVKDIASRCPEGDLILDQDVVAEEEDTHSTIQGCFGLGGCVLAWYRDHCKVRG